MKKMALVLFTASLLAFSVSGCSGGTSKEEVYNAPYEEDGSSTGLIESSDKEELGDVKLGAEISKDEYVNNLISYSKELREEFTVLGEVASGDKTDTEAWAKSNVDQIDVIDSVLVKYLELNPTTEFQYIQDEFIVGATKFRESLALMSDALKALDDTKYRASFEKVTDAEDYLQYAEAWLQTIASVPVGTDGTLFSDDLKVLDRQENIDRDSVLINISKDGKELIGKWGRKNDDGTVSISLVLNADGTYQGYNSGEYEKRESYLDGTWEYDYLNRHLIVHNDRDVTDGVAAELGNVGTFDIERFNEEGIQLLDTQSSARFVFVSAK